MASISYRTLGAVAVAALAAILFWHTAYPTITWWDSSQYSLAASTLGITAPPGSLLLTMLGWLVTRLPLGSEAYLLNLFAGALAALAAVLVYLIAVRLADINRPADESATTLRLQNAVFAGATFGALTVAFGETLWEHAIKFTPYVLTAVFTALILLTKLHWWKDADRPDAWRKLALLGLLFGLDFSVHRTNSLLLPGVLVWIALGHPRTLRDPKAWLGGAAAMAVGLTAQLSIIPIAATTDSILNIGDASNLARFWDYVSLEMMGGGFLVDFFPRKAPFWSVQVADLLRVLGANFFHWKGPLGPLGLLPAFVGIAGLAFLCRRNWRLGTALALVLFLQAAVTVLYFNTPENFFRPFDRHYLPVCLTFGITIAYGFGVLLTETVRRFGPRRQWAVPLAACALMLAPLSQLAANWTTHDASRRYFTRDFAANMLQGLPPNAILFTAGDNDTFPLWYVQAAEGVRPDVQIVNQSLANTFFFIDQISRRDPAFPISMSREERLSLSPRELSDTTMVVPVLGPNDQLGISEETPIPESITLGVTPSIQNHLLPSDLVLLDMLRTNRWQRPICFAITVPDVMMVGLQDFGRLDGLFQRIVPIESPPVDHATLRANLLETYTYEGYADESVRLDAVSRNMGMFYTRPFLELIAAERQGNSNAACRETVAKYLEALPPVRLGEDAPRRAQFEAMCEPES